MAIKRGPPGPQSGGGGKQRPVLAEPSLHGPLSYFLTPSVPTWNTAVPQVPTSSSIPTTAVNALHVPLSAYRIS